MLAAVLGGPTIAPVDIYAFRRRHEPCRVDQGAFPQSDLGQQYDATPAAKSGTHRDYSGDAGRPEHDTEEPDSKSRHHGNGGHRDIDQPGRAAAGRTASPRHPAKYVAAAADA